MSDIYKMVHDFSIKVQEAKDDAVIAEVVTIAKENGIDETIYLNRQAIVRALIAHTPMKPIIDITGVRCGECWQYIKADVNYCPHCGRRVKK